jgi:hypothetical protein
MTWQIFADLRQCQVRRGRLNYGKNFCANCGKQLVDKPFLLFRVESIDGQLKPAELNSGCPWNSVSSGTGPTALLSD